MDDAMMTRMIHVSMQFDVKSWADWATKNNIDSRGIAFVLTYPEVVTGKRTTPRSLVQFFSFLKHIKNLKAELARVMVLAKSALDDVTTAAFAAFVTDNLEALINPEDILDATDFGPIGARIRETAEGSGGSKRIDRLATICTRLCLAISQTTFVANALHKQNLVSFLSLECIPTDLRFSLHRDISNLPEPKKRALVQDKRLAKLVLEGLKR
jgi:hypothetical protein